SWPTSPRIKMRPIGPQSPIRLLGWPRSSFDGGASLRSGRWPSRVWMTSRPASRAASSTVMQGSIALRSRPTSLPSDSPKPPGSRKSRCMSMITSAARARSNSMACGCADNITMSPSPLPPIRRLRGKKCAVPGAKEENPSETETDPHHAEHGVVVAFADTERQLLRVDQAVVDEVVVLHAGLDVPLAELRRHAQRIFHGDAGREHADIAVV